jgi:hypothetical protein
MAMRESRRIRRTGDALVRRLPVSFPFYLSFDSRVHAYFWVADIFSLKSAGA